jgi:anthranilate phosphoribosyltransferase
MKSILNRLFDYQTLSKQEAYDILKVMGEGQLNLAQISAFLTVFQMRSVTVDELTGFRDALLDLCVKMDLSEFDPIDLCGTGGDGKDTFNISTLASFVVAGAGVKVAKHGNYGVSSTCGSSNVMEHLGYIFTNETDILKRQIDRAGICFLHAPLFHPAMRHVGPVRRDLGVKTFFNMLGPMVNPSKPQKQLVGVFSLELARLYHYIYQKTEKQYVILHSLDGYDEISLTGPFKYISNAKEEVYSPDTIGMKTLSQEDLFGGRSIADAAEIFMNILTGKGTEAQNNVVCANAGMAVHCAREDLSVHDAISVAKESLMSGNALHSLKKLIKA